MTAEKLFEPFDLGPNRLQNRVVMAPLTRSRADGNDTPKDMHVTYYGQRASAGLIIAEATQISNEGKGYAWTPGIYSDEQVAAWKKVTDNVHAEGGKIFLQLWHVGRISHPDLQDGGRLPVSASAVKPEGEAFTENGFKEIPTPRALETDELPRVVEDFVKASENAKKAGFDGVEVHSANGYLLDQFLQDGTNRREDAYGGSIENRMRFPLEVIDAVVKVWGADRVGVRISPGSGANDISESNPEELFTTYVKALNERGLAYLHVIEGLIWQDREKGTFDMDGLRALFDGAYMGNNEYTREVAIERVNSGKIDLACFGRPYIANPDLVERLALDAPMNEPDKDTFYGGDEKGYTDYPFLTDEERRTAKAA
ncbi:alkene reductase [Fulvimarina sp. 2208YS6-2-32]|uniref:Alkene reductase n=1 Tax=Fulvimarina uroteuthidis TaxID=3098149 RepID=A0ABU5I487_9HYPH|nr:alkene reductase [Fulvimarina sp. 2208YS6-2-32]MDY8109743.1 alkene reductase [Fulvimarina sp. 2208YS6-2-32]